MIKKYVFFLITLSYEHKVSCLKHKRKSVVISNPYTFYTSGSFILKKNLLSSAGEFTFFCRWWNFWISLVTGLNSKIHSEGTYRFSFADGINNINDIIISHWTIPHSIVLSRWFIQVSSDTIHFQPKQIGSSLILCNEHCLLWRSRETLLTNIGRPAFSKDIPMAVRRLSWVSHQLLQPYLWSPTSIYSTIYIWLSIY